LRGTRIFYPDRARQAYLPEVDFDLVFLLAYLQLPNVITRIIVLESDELRDIGIYCWTNFDFGHAISYRLAS
jgi:hypothetical protein